MIINTNSTNTLTTNYSNKSNDKKTEITHESSNLPTEKLDKKNSIGEERYDALAINGWFNNSAFEKDENLKEEFKSYLGEMSQRSFSMTLFSMIRSFTPGMVENNDLLPLHLAPKHKDASIELSSVSSITNYFQDNYNSIVENVNKWGGDATEALKNVSGLINFFKNYESKEQENQYIALGQGNKNA
tara:strand:- start:71 stop:631 length:561 start_codon:yes stop_codon:yes gene_type:complete